MASDNKNLASQRREESGIVYFDRGTREGRNGRSVWTELPEGVQVSASSHENNWWAMSFHIPANMLMDVYGKRLTDGGIVRGNFYKCDETIHPHFGTWNPVVAPQPDFHRPECFGTMQVEK